MSEPTPKNACSPSNIFGPPQQTLFLGCSISSFSATVGWNEQISEVTVQVVQDTDSTPDGCPGKVYWDSTLTMQTTTAADPGFIYPNIGAAVYFRVGVFEYSGLVQSFSQSNSTSGKPVWTIKLIDPRQILDGTQLIIGGYAGSVYNTPNILNVYGFTEQFGSYCPLVMINGGVFGSPAGGFGGSYVNDNGMQWNRIKDAVSVLTSSILPVSNMWSPFGRLLFRSPSGPDTTTVNYGLLPLATASEETTGYNNYLIDISEVPIAPSYWRLSGTSVSLMQAISDICADSGCDYYIELLPVIIGGIVYKVIKVRTASRVGQPLLGQISTFIETATKVVSDNYGLEMRNETTAAVVTGGPIQSIYQAFQDTDPGLDDPSSPPEAKWILEPYFGLDSNGNALIATLDSKNRWQFTADLTSLNDQLSFTLPGPLHVVINEVELQRALGGLDSWLSFAMDDAAPSPLGAKVKTAKIAAGRMGQAHLQNLAGAAKNGKIAGRDLADVQVEVSRRVDDIFEHDIQTIYEFVNTYATEFYGRKFQVRIPYTAVKTDPESAASSGIAQVITSEIPSDGGWTDYPTVLNQPNPSVLLDFFTLDDNRLGPFVSFNTANSLDFSLINSDDFFVDSNTLYLKATVDQQLVYFDLATYFSPRVVVTLPQSIQDYLPPPSLLGMLAPDAGDIQAANDGAGGAQLAANIKKAKATVGGYALNSPLMYRFRMPDAAAIPLKSNVATYMDSTWTYTAVDTFALKIPGITHFEQDDGLVPWEYGSTNNMLLAGQSKVGNAVISAMQVGEMGDLTVPGFPSIPLGAELGAYTGGAGNSLVENRTITSNPFSQSGWTGGNYYTMAMGQWTGLYGPNVTSINVGVGVQGFQTTYQMRTFTPQFGRFTKNNAERLKKIGQNQLRFQKAMRLNELQLNRRANIAAVQGAIYDKRNTGKGLNAEVHSPHEVLVGQQLPHMGGTGIRNIIATENILECTREMVTGYANKAFMSLDGLLRPVSLGGDGGLPRFLPPISGASGCNTAFSAPSIPPISLNRSRASDKKYDVSIATISNAYLNPLTNPNTPGSSWSWSYAHGTENGHDFDIVGRNITPPSGTGQSLIMPVGGINLVPPKQADYNNDYRFMALRGPLVLQSWGYDTNNKPVPNQADTEAAASGGTFTTAGLQDTFLDNWLVKSHTWPVAPVDLRLDRNRGVWVTPPPPGLVVAKMITPLLAMSTGLARVRQLEGGTAYDSNGNPLSFNTDPTVEGPTIFVRDVINSPVPSDGIILAYYNQSACEYWPLKQSALDQIIRFQIIQPKPYSTDAYLLDTPTYTSGYELNVDGSFTTDDSGNPKVIGLRDTVGKWGPSPSGANGWACLKSDDLVSNSGVPLFEIMFIESYARYIHFKTKEDMGYTTSKRAKADYIVQWGDADNGKDRTQDFPAGSGSDDGKVWVDDPLGTFQRSLTGATGLAIYNERTDKYYITRCDTKAEEILFQIPGPVAPGGSLTLTSVNDYYRGQQPYNATCPNVIVKDPVGLLGSCPTGLAIATYNPKLNGGTACDGQDFYVVTTVSGATLGLTGYTFNADRTANPDTVTSIRNIKFGQCFNVSVQNNCQVQVDPYLSQLLTVVTGITFTSVSTGIQVTQQLLTAKFMLCNQPTGTTSSYVIPTGGSCGSSILLNVPYTFNVINNQLQVTTIPVTVCATGAPNSPSTYTIRIPSSGVDVVTSGSCSGGSVSLTTRTIQVLCPSATGTSC